MKILPSRSKMMRDADGVAQPRVGDKQVAHVFEGVAAVPPGAAEHGGRQILLASFRLVVGEVNEPIAIERGMQCKVLQALEAQVEHFRHTGDGLWVDDAAANETKAASALGDEDAAVGQKRHPERAIQSLDRHDAESLRGAAEQLRLRR
jgi:hypothetical protein